MNITSLLNPDFIELENNTPPENQHATIELVRLDLLTYICKTGYCPLCDRNFVSKGSASRHFYCVHSAPLRCPCCSKKVKYLGRMDLLKQHLIRCQAGKTINQQDLKSIYSTALRTMGIPIPSSRQILR